MRKILITGGAGFIGSHLVEKLLGKKNYVVVLDNFDHYYSPKEKEKNLSKIKNSRNFSLVRGDVRSDRLLRKLFSEFKPTYIIHLAAKVGVRHSFIMPKQYFEVNTLGTLNLLNIAKHRKITNFIFISSSSIYGGNAKIPFSEDDKVDNQLSPYAISKRSAELLCRQYAEIYKIPITCLRLFSVYGPRQRPDLVIRKFIEKITSDKTVELYGDGNSARDYIYIDDVISGILKCLDKPFKFEIINLGRSEPVKLSTLVSFIETIFNKKANKLYRPNQMGEIEATHANIQKAEKLIGWKPNINVEEGLMKIKKYLYCL